MTVHASPGIELSGPPLEPSSPELQQLLDAIGEGVFERERDGVAPFDAIELIRRARLGALRLPRELGGADVSLRELFAVLIRLAETDPNVAHILRVHFYFVESQRSAPDPQDGLKWLEEIARGTIFGGSLTELGTGNTGVFDPAAFKTTLTPNGDGFVLDGTKYYSTGSLYADKLTVVAATPDGRVVTAVVPSDRDGVRLEDDWDGMGQALTGTGTSHFEGVSVGADEVIAYGAAASRAPRYTGAFMQLYLTGVITGVIRAAARDAAALVLSRDRTFTHAPSETAPSDPLLQEVVGEMVSSAFAAEASVLAAADAIDVAAASVVAGAANAQLAEQASLAAAKAKVVVDGLAAGVGWQVFDVGGASATKQSKNLDRHWRNARTIASHNPAIYKAMAIGDHAINGTPLPQGWFF
jgi:alkylation response protein AidB-like acyl-CoA dehydrogenase